MKKVSIIIPVLNEADAITETLQILRSQQPGDFEIIVVDGGSKDNTVNLAHEHARVITAAQGRANQMNAGADIAVGDVLLFLHADTQLPAGAIQSVSHALSDYRRWGRFNVMLSGKQWPFRVIETMMNWRSCLTSIATGDQVIFVQTRLFNRVGGFPDIPLMEDVALSKRLRSFERAVCVNESVITSSRRWQKNGIIKTVLLMWWLRLLYFLGVSPQRLVSLYY